MGKQGKILALVTSVLFAVVTQVHATTVLPLDLRELTKISEFVVLGHVVNVHTEGQLKPRKITTVVQVEVDECLVGKCEQILVLKQRGGQFRFDDGAYTQFVSGMPKFESGERVVLFLERTDTNRLVVAGLSQGKFTVQGETNSAPLRRDLGGLNFVDPRTKKSVPVTGVAIMPTRLDVLRQTLRTRRPVLDVRPVRLPSNSGEGQ